MCLVCPRMDIVGRGLCGACYYRLRSQGKLSQYSKKSTREKFDSHYTKGSGCWLWNGFHDRDGYGKWENGRGKAFRAHRLMWEFTFGEIPEGMLVCHHCDVRNCVNPDHLFLGTPMDNMLDCRKKGRQRRACGEANNSKLTAKQALEIIADVRPQRTIANEYGVTQGLISKIKSGKNWKHLLTPQ